MIRVNLQLAMAKKRIRSLSKVAEGTGLSRTTLTALYFEKGKGIQFETLDILCKFLECTPGDLLEYEP